MSNSILKKIHLWHGMAMLLLLLIGVVLLGGSHTFLDYFFGEALPPSTKYGSISSIFFLATIFVGALTCPQMLKAGGLLIGGGIIFLLWSILLLHSPSHIKIDEILIAWVAWATIAIVLNGIVYYKIDKISYFLGEEEELLDFFE